MYLTVIPILVRKFWPVLVLAWIALHRSASAERLKPFPWINRGDPKIQTEIFVRDPMLEIDGRRVGVAHFSVLQEGKPEPLPFECFLHQALLREVSAEVDYFAPPWENLLSWRSLRLRPDRIAAAADAARRQNLDLVVAGSVDSLFRTASNGLIVKVTISVVSAEDGRMLWYGRKKASWLRNFSIEDCLLHLAESFVDEWRHWRDH